MDIVDFNAKYSPLSKEIKKIPLPSDKVVFIDPSACIGCGICEEVCPFGLPEKKKYGLYEIDRDDLCIECTACKRNCPVDAIRMNERDGCGCLWDVKNRNNKDRESNCCS